jgi:hypothetical protein
MRPMLHIATVLGLLAATTAWALPPMDDAGFTAYILDRLKPHVRDGEKLSGEKPMTIVLKERNGTASVGLETLRQICQAKPADCDMRVDAFVDEWAGNFGPPAAPDLAKLHAEIWPDGAMAFFEQIGRVGDNPVGIRYAGDLWAVCINGRQMLTENQLADMGLKKADVVARCEQNTIAAQQPFDSYIAGLPKGGLGMLSATNEATLLLAHDLWAPIAKRFDGALIVCAPNADIVYYGHGADSEALAAMETRVKRDEADRFTASNLDGIKGDPRDVHVRILKWTESGWETVP